MENKNVFKLYKSTKLLIRKFIKYFLLSLFDFFNKGFGYHAAAITFFTLMSLVPLFMVITILISYVFNFNTDFFVSIAKRFFPSITNEFLDFILDISNKRALFGIVGFMFSFYFASNIFTAMYTAFGYIFEKETSIKKSAFIRLFAIPIFILILTLLYILNLFISTFLDIIMSFKLWIYIEKFLGVLHLKALLDIITNISIIIYFLTYLFMVLFIYRFLIPLESISIGKVKGVSLFISFILYILKSLFSVYIILSSKTNPIYGSLSGIFAFLAWLYISYGVILFGARIIYYMEIEKRKE